VDCVATGARPAVEFNWYIGETKLNAHIKLSEEEGEDGKKTYISTLQFSAAPKHDGEELKCEAVHQGYSVQAIADEANWAKAQLNLEFMPVNSAKTKETFYGLKEGEKGQARIKFRANPKPTQGQWVIGETVVPIGAGSVDSKFMSSQILDGDDEGEYQVELTIVQMVPELADKTYQLEVTNSVGTTTYQFELKITEKPKAEGANTTVIGIIILVVIIVLVGGVTIIARAKGIWCFGGKKAKDEDAEQAVDKEGSDTESAEDGTAGKDETGNKEDTNEAKKDEPKKSATSGVVTRVTNLFAVMKKSVKKPKDGKYSAETPESEMKLHENEEKKETENDNVVYADLDKSALGTGGTRRDANESEKTEYAEIRPQN